MARLRIDILSLFPGYFSGPFDESILKRAQEKGILEIRLIDIRDFATGKHRTVDDRPYGGGPGMVMMAGPLVAAIRSVKTSSSVVIYLSPQGEKLTAAVGREVAQATGHLILVCGHYEGIDERVLQLEVDREISIGDYVLSNGALAAIVFTDVVARFIPGVIGHEDAAIQDSFEEGIFDCPHYTRPEEFEGLVVPPVLLSGHHSEIERWRRRQAIEKTERVRPDLT